jgi:hypothetical protein
MSVMTPMEFSRAEYSDDHSALFRRNSRNLRCIVAVVDSLAGARNHCEGSVGLGMTRSLFLFYPPPFSTICCRRSRGCLGWVFIFSGENKGAKGTSEVVREHRRSLEVGRVHPRSLEVGRVGLQPRSLAVGRAHYAVSGGDDGTSEVSGFLLHYITNRPILSIELIMS